MVETVQVKMEVDNPNWEAFLPPPSSSTQNQMAPHHDTPTSNNDGSVAAAETGDLNNLLAGKHFLDKLCLVKLQGKYSDGNERTFQWPALHYSNKIEFLEDVKENVNRSFYLKLAKHFKQYPLKGNKPSRGCRIAFLLGVPAIEDSIIALGEGMVEKCEDHIDKLLKDDDYKDNEKFKKAVAVVDRRVAELFDSSNEDEDDEGSVDFDSGGTPPSHSSSNQARVSTSPNTQASASASSTNQDSVEVIAVEDTPANKSGGKDNKRKGKSKDVTASKKKKSLKQTPKSKSRGTQPSMVTPLPLPSKGGDKDISKHLRDACFTSHKLMTDKDAWHLLETKYGFFCGEDGKFYLPPTSVSEDVKPVATSLMGLRKDLCAKGLPESIQPLSTEEKIDIARWVRYAHVKGLLDGQEIKPDDLGEPISKFMDEAAWPLLRDNFGCSWNGTYKVRLTPHGEETKTFETTSGVDGHFARFGIQCIPDEPGDDILSRKDRLSIELFFATPSFEVLNTFERIDENAKRKRKRSLSNLANN